MSVCIDHLTLDVSEKKASSLDGIKRKSPFLFCFFLVLNVVHVRYHRRGFVFTKTPFCSRPKVFFKKKRKEKKKKKKKETLRIKKPVLANNLTNKYL